MILSDPKGLWIGSKMRMTRENERIPATILGGMQIYRY